MEEARQLGKEGDLVVTFWGVRGSAPTPQRCNLEYGGNTPCVQVQYRDEAPLIFDGGTGLPEFGRSMGRRGLTRLDMHLFFTHFHWDHVQGVPHFPPLYDGATDIALHSGIDAGRLRQILSAQMDEPYYPVPWRDVPARRVYGTVEPAGLRVGGVMIYPFALSHPGGCCGYRIETPDAVIVLATDHEHGDARADAVLREAAAGADLLIYDAQYTPGEYLLRQGWGHSTWLHGVELGAAANVKRLVLFHHDPSHDDGKMREIGGRAAAEFPQTLVAREGCSIHVGATPTA